MAWLFAVPIAAFTVFIIVGAITGHVEVRSCCGIADPHCDARMREAFSDAELTTSSCQPHQEGPTEGDRRECDRLTTAQIAPRLNRETQRTGSVREG